MANFNPAYSITKNIEGGYANDSVDKGGETYKGISRENFPEWIGWPIVDANKALSNFPDAMEANEGLQNLVRLFYKKEFWDGCNLDYIIDQAIANEIFDTAVNMGVYIASVFLQKALNVLNRNQTLYHDIPITGKIGSLTTEAANNSKESAAVVKIMNVLQGARYVEICLANPKQEKFIRGWLSRVE
jgi:lysozyme family protein